MVYRKIGVLLSRIELFLYFYFGWKKYLIFINVELYKLVIEFLKFDIYKFFFLIRVVKVYKVFVEKFEMLFDVVYIMINFLIFVGKVFIGSLISMVMVFWVNKDMFDEFSNFVVLNSLVFMVYVDDVVFFGLKILKGFVV